MTAGCLRHLGIKTISPGLTLRPDRDKWGMGVRHALFPVPAFGTPRRGLLVSRRHSPRQAELPASWLGRPRPRGQWILSEAFQLASAGGCATGLRTRSRHAWKHSASSPIGSGSATACDGAFARNHGSRLCSLKLPFFHSPAVSFLTSPALGSFSRNLPNPVVFPMRPLRLSAFWRFSSGGANVHWTRQSRPHRADAQ